MRIHSLRFAALGPFAGEEIIDFDALGSSALFLIDGPTGAGKSTIIDAIVFALYGDVAGEASDKERLRSAFAAPEIESFAELDFSTMSGRYRVRRTPAYERAKKRGSGTTAEAASVQVWQSVGDHTWEPLSTRHTEADAEITHAVGLTRSQFLQTVVLPQGEFATFLRSESADRLPILERIFATEVYSRIQAAFDDERRAALRAREQSLSDLQSARDVLRGRLEGSAFEVEAAHDSSTWPDQRDELLEQLGEHVVASAAATARSDERLAQATARMDSLIASEQAAKAEAAARLRLDDAEGTVARLSIGIDLAGGELDAAIARGESEIESCAADSAIESALPALRQQAAAALGDIEGHDLSIAELERTRDQVIPARMAAFVTGLRAEVSDAERTFAAHEQQVDDLRATRVLGLSGELAQALAEGEACPVCGSREHPAPAPVHPDHVSAEVVAEHVEELQRQRDLLDDLRTRVAVVTASAPTGPASEVEATAAGESHEAMLDALQRDIDDLAGISARIEEIRAQRAGAQSTYDDCVARIEADSARVLAARGEFDSVAERAQFLRATRRAHVELLSLIHISEPTRPY